MRPRPVSSRRRRPRLDLLSIALAPLGIVVVLLAQFLDGSPLAGLLQGSSALVVGGGTLAAILVSFSPLEVARAVRSAGRAFLAPDDDFDRLAAQMVELSVRAHRKGPAALEPEIDDIADPFLRDGLALVVDGTSAPLLNEMLAVEKAAREAEEDVPARIFEAAAGYAPTWAFSEPSSA